VLNDLDHFIGLCVLNSGVFSHTGGYGFQGGMFEADGMYCPGCGDIRRVRVWARSPVRSTYSDGLNLADTDTDKIAGQLAPAVFTFICVQDDTRFTALLFRGPDAFELAIFPMVRGGLATANTPKAVAFYLDQAQRAQSAAAKSAAVAMYRAALEHVLFEQNFTRRTLGAKLEDLGKAIVAGAAPKWALELDPAYLTVINKLANAAIHPGDGDVTAQATFDTEILMQLEIAVGVLMDVIYEREHKDKARLAALQAALTNFET
jgi:hypothetical protein